MNIASVTLIRTVGASPGIDTYSYEYVRGYTDISWTPNHVVFNMEDGTIVSYRADRVFELTTSKE